MGIGVDEIGSSFDRFFRGSSAKNRPLDAHHVGEELGHAVIGQVLVHGQSTYAWAVTGARWLLGVWVPWSRAHRHNGDVLCGGG
jgi:hypothetical protein